MLYNVRGTGGAEVSVLRLAPSGSHWKATWVTSLTHDTLDVPTTATLATGSLWTVNARFGTVPDPASAEYWITRLPQRS